MNEKKLQDRINRRLSGLTASEQRRMRIRAAVSPEREDERRVKRTFSKALVFALVAALLAATVAFAERFNLFNFFGGRDGRYSAVAPYATLEMAEPVLVEHPELGTAEASIDSAYFDGLSLNLAYRITQSRKVEEYTPAADELQLMKIGNADVLAADFSQNEPGIEVLSAWNRAIENGTPYGYRKTAVYTGDHTVTDDGVDIFPDSAFPTYNEKGEFCEMREFACPLPDEIRGRGELKVNMDVRQETVYRWFDGTNCYWRTEWTEIGTMTAVIPRSGETRRFSGAGKIGGVPCTASAEVSPMVSVITFESEEPLNAFLCAAPEGTDDGDCWAEMTAADESGNIYRPYGCVPLDGSAEFTMQLKGTGVLPETLTVYVYPMCEGDDNPVLSALDGIVMKAAD